ncbi:MAG: hypothetical protein NWF05_00120 [Candidatus Bathyarchaeota archaeon]|nr:hypothetical protein [Candidatus Bathyarchaeota archaeon]
MQISPSVTVQGGFEERFHREPARRLTPEDYSKAGILKSYDWSVKGREAHDKEMANYRQYLMKLCILSNKSAVSAVGDE